MTLDVRNHNRVQIVVNTEMTRDEERKIVEQYLGRVLLDYLEAGRPDKKESIKEDRVDVEGKSESKLPPEVSRKHQGDVVAGVQERDELLELQENLMSQDEVFAIAEVGGWRTLKEHIVNGYFPAPETRRRRSRYWLKEDILRWLAWKDEELEMRYSYRKWLASSDVGDFNDYDSQVE